MASKAKIKLWIIVGGLVIVFLIVVLNPFLIVFGFGDFSRSTIQVFFAILSFFAAAILLDNFNRLRVIINKKELEDKKLTELENRIEKLAEFRTEKKEDN